MAKRFDHEADTNEKPRLHAQAGAGIRPEGDRRQATKTIRLIVRGDDLGGFNRRLNVG
jgi:hypothetical protein